MRLQPCLPVILLFLVLNLSARGADKAPIFEKQENKAKHRWSISDWIETRDKMRIQDLWLAMHLPSPYEFYLGGIYRTGNLGSGPAYQAWNLNAAAYAYFFGVEIQRDLPNIESQWIALVNFRLFGPYNQATNFTLQFGTRGENRAGGDVWSLLAGAHLTLYVAKAFGGTLLYRRGFGGGVGVVGASDRFEGGAFIDFNLVRLHVDYFTQNVENDPGRSFRGIQFGTRLYF